MSSINPSVRLNDNSQIDQLYVHSIPKILNLIVDKPLEDLASTHSNIFIFPNNIDHKKGLSEDQKVLESASSKYENNITDSKYWTGNVMGFLAYENERLTIRSRFGGNSDYFTHYMLSRVFEIKPPHLIESLFESSSDNQVLDILIFLFPHFLSRAMLKGLFKLYVRRQYNDDRVKGVIDIARHIKLNTPFIGKVAYNTREFSYDNHLTQLIRHTIEFIKARAYGDQILDRVKDQISYINKATPSYKAGDRYRLVNLNKKNPVRHAYYQEYLDLQRLCISILTYEKDQIGTGPNQLYGILFNGAWLWEEYMNLLMTRNFYHPQNMEQDNFQLLFDNQEFNDLKDRMSDLAAMNGLKYCDNLGSNLIYPDFIGKNNNQTIADAKYKPLYNIDRDDLNQMLQYMIRFGSSKGYFLYPNDQYPTSDVGNDGSRTDLTLHLNSGVYFKDESGQRTNNVRPRENCCIVFRDLKIPEEPETFIEFIRNIQKNEIEFMKDLVI